MIVFQPITTFSVRWRRFGQAFCVFNVAETVESLGGTGIDVESMAPWGSTVPVGGAR